MNVLLVIDVEDLNDKIAFEKHLKKEGFDAIEGETFAYKGISTTPVMHTRAFIFEVVSKALEKSPAKHLSIVCQIGENPMETYIYDKNTKFFNEVK